MKTLHPPTIDYFLEQLPDKLLDRIFYFWEAFQYVYNQSTFHIYDHALAELMTSFYQIWDNILSHSSEYGRRHDTPSDDNYYYNMSEMDSFSSNKSEKTYYKIAQERI